MLPPPQIDSLSQLFPYPEWRHPKTENVLMSEPPAENKENKKKKRYKTKEMYMQRCILERCTDFINFAQIYTLIWMIVY